MNKSDELKSDISAIWHFIKFAHRIRPSYMPLAAATAVLQTITPFINIIIPRYIINELLGLQRIEMLVVFVSMLIAGNAVISIIGTIVTKQVEISGEYLADGFELHVGNHIMHMDFEKLEDAKILDLKEKALYNIKLHDALRGGPKAIIDLFQKVFTVIGTVAIIMTLSPLVAAVMAAIVLLNTLIHKRIQTTKFQFYKDIAIYNRQFMYFRDLTQKFTNAKDVRIYHMSDYILNRVDYFNNTANGIFHKMFLKQRKNDGLTAMNLQLQSLIAYAYAVWNVYIDNIAIGDFYMYIAAANQFSNVLSQFMTGFVDLRMLGKVLMDYLNFEEITSNNYNTYGSKTVEGISSIRIDFCNVWFKYPGADDYVLKDVSITIHNNEKLSIVGRNGAGKTTFIKLLCRLYKPDKGKILLNGININEFDESEYIKLLSVLFQDYKIFSFTVQENLAFHEKADLNKILSALSEAGALSIVNDLPRGIDTPLYKNFDSNGTELSGGQMQKLAIARVLYKDALIVILDEPTAALDPYAEYEIFSRFHEMTKQKTAIYISHRLSSCRFCDKIAVFDNGMLVEYGVHDQLVNNRKLYSEMWEAQAQYYQA